MEMDVKKVLALGWPILSILLACSIVSLAVTLHCWSLLRKIKSGRWREDDASMEDILDVIEGRLAVLGTIANAAPFIGLLGTVIGIIRAFNVISINTGGGIGAISGSISEALVSTAAGLAVAIPASMLYNYFSHQSQRIAGKLQSGKA